MVYKYVGKVFNYLSKLGLLNWIPDRLYLHLFYFFRTNKKLNIDDPRSFNEKLQWLKLNNRNKIYTIMVDKYESKMFFESKIDSGFQVPIYGVFDRFEDIDFQSLPDSFVIKTTHDSGGVIVVKNKKDVDFKKIERKIKKSLNTNYYYNGREWPYKNVRPRIIVEKFLVDKQNESLIDYKVMCFNGEPQIIQTITERNQDGFKDNYFDSEWNELMIPRKSTVRNCNIPSRPRNLNKMIELSRNVSKNIPFLRVDFFEVNSKLYFGEFTFFPANGCIDFLNEKDNLMLGDLIKLDN